MNQFYKDIMDAQFGKHRGGLWRSERDWYVFADKDPKGVMENVAVGAKDSRDGLYDKQGFSRSRKMRWMGDIPLEVAIANPDLMTDPEAARRFFKEFPAFSSKG